VTGVISGVIRLVVAVTYGDRLNEGLLAAVGARGLVGAICSERKRLRATLVGIFIT